ncbi:hypothetical protein C2I27_04180 [Priestia megaterium]|uniref:RCC1 domain-containing protein n=1 Tax=Priestia megaterium TaxID=1404 RepID=UPI000D5188F6|nr:hypothetical protein [Priestia megaterium]PVC75091.1 hypothetical protein C2I27_04180 [Priestia megaterium]
MSLSFTSMFLMQDSTIKVVGSNDYGQLGIGNTTYQSTAQNVNISGVKQIGCGYAHTILLMQDGTVKAVGRNVEGQLGIGNTIDQSTIQNVNISGVKQIACGANHTMFLMEDGTVKASGYNNYGTLGIGTTSSQSAPVSVNISGVKQIACGYNHTMFLMEDGTVKGAGRSSDGQLGIGITSSQPAPVSVNISEVKQIACGSYHTMFLMKDGTVKAVGRNVEGQLGIGNTNNQTLPQDVNISGVKQIACGYSHTMFLMEDGTAKGVGYNANGQLGIGKTSSQSTIQNVNISGVQQICCGRYHTMFLMKDSTVKAVGRNAEGQLGIEILGSHSTIKNVNISGVKSLWEDTGILMIKTLYLFQDGEDIKKYQMGWMSVGKAPVTKSMFDTDGITDLSIITNDVIQQLTSDEPELLCWTDEENANRRLNLTAAPSPQLLIAKEDIEVKELESVSIDAIVNQSDNDLKITLSGDNGENWAGKAAVNINDLSNFKTNGLSVSEFNALSKEQLKSLCPNGKIRMAFYLEQENTTNAVEIRSVTINERLYTMTPEVESLSVLYSLLEAESPDLYASRDDGVTWQKIKRDELADLSALPEGKQLRVKVVLSNGQELQALSYSWI